MIGEILLRLVSVLTVDDVRELRAAGCEHEVRAWLDDFDRMVVRWRNWDYGHIDSQVWADVQVKLNELRGALRGLAEGRYPGTEGKG